MSSKVFKFDQLLEKEDICNLSSELSRLQRGVAKGEKLVIFGRRNTGKTSLVKNVVAKSFQEKHRKHFVMFVDFMEVKSLESIHNRIQVAFAEAFSQAFPAKSLLAAAQKYLLGLKPSMEIDPITGVPSFSLSSSKDTPSVSFKEIFRIVREEISQEKKVLLIFDEFQDIALVEEAAAMLRSELQYFSSTPMLILGSKKHLLRRMFSKPEAPFADFGSDVEFGAIDYQEYHAYILERFAASKLRMDFVVSQYLQNQLHCLPEPINIVGAHLVDSHTQKTVTKELIGEAIKEVVEGRRHRFEVFLGGLSEPEEIILIKIAEHGPIAEPTGKKFLSYVNFSHGTVRKVVERLEDKGLIEREQTGFQVANPLLQSFLIRFR